MGSAWNYSAKERGAGGKFSAEFEVYEITMGAHRVWASCGFTRARRFCEAPQNCKADLTATQTPRCRV